MPQGRTSERSKRLPKSQGESQNLKLHHALEPRSIYIKRLSPGSSSLRTTKYVLTTAEHLAHRRYLLIAIVEWILTAENSNVGSRLLLLIHPNQLFSVPDHHQPCVSLYPLALQSPSPSSISSPITPSSFSLRHSSVCSSPFPQAGSGWTI